MAYSTSSDLEKQISSAELIQLTDDAGSGAVNSGVIAEAIDDADAEIDGYLASRGEVPLTTVPGIVRKLSVDISIYNLYARRHDSIPEIREKRYDNAIRLLLMIAQGKISLGADDPAGNPPEMAGIDYEACDQVHTSTKLGNF